MTQLRQKKLAELQRRNCSCGQLGFHGSRKCLADAKLFRTFLWQLFTKQWIVYAKRPFGGPNHVLPYLARYTHGIAISNYRLIGFDHNKRTFRLKA